MREFLLFAQNGLWMKIVNNTSSVFVVISCLDCAEDFNLAHSLILNDIEDMFGKMWTVGIRWIVCNALSD